MPARALDKQHAQAGLGEHGGGDAAARAGPDDDDVVGVAQRTASTTGTGSGSTAFVAEPSARKPTMSHAGGTKPRKPA